MWINYDNLMLNTQKLCVIMVDGSDIQLYSKPNDDPDMFSFENEEAAEAAYKLILTGIKEGLPLVELNFK